MNRVEFRLRDISGWSCDASCTPTALAAITGLSLERVTEFLARAAATFGCHISPSMRDDYSPKHWMKAIDMLGGDVNVDIRWDEHDYCFRPTITDYLREPPDQELRLVFCDNANGTAHVFAHNGSSVVDTYTDGAIWHQVRVPEAYQDLRVKFSCRVVARM